MHKFLQRRTSLPKKHTLSKNGQYPIPLSDEDINVIYKENCNLFFDNFHLNFSVTNLPTKPKPKKRQSKPDKPPKPLSRNKEKERIGGSVKLAQERRKSSVQGRQIKSARGGN
jgi:hypothetical protein